MPPNTASVTRPGKYSNPFRVERLSGPRSPRGEEWVVIDTRTDAWAFPYAFSSKVIAAKHAVDCFESELTDLKRKEIRRDLSALNIACFCALNQPCHGDVLLSVACEAA
jgi:hypothetical protein